ncbi:hypothetical protein S245_044354, partial [Arachis hypogaea]
ISLFIGSLLNGVQVTAQNPEKGGTFVTNRERVMNLIPGRGEKVSNLQHYFVDEFPWMMMMTNDDAMLFALKRLQTDELDGAGDGTCHHSERIGFPFSLSRSVAVCEGEEEGSNENSHIEGCNHSSLSTTPSFFYVDRSEVSFSVGSCLLPHPDKSFLLLRQIPFIQSYAGDVNRSVCTILTMIATLHVAQLFFFHILLVEKNSTRLKLKSPKDSSYLPNLQISWMEKFLRKGTKITAPVPMTPAAGTTGLGGFDVQLSRGSSLRSNASALNVGVLHLVPTLDVFPLLEDPKTYEPNTIDLADPSELEYWFTILSEHLPDLVDKAVASEGRTDDAKRRGDAFARAFSAHLARLIEEAAAYGKLGLANLLEMREECLREFQFVDAYRSIKQRYTLFWIMLLLSKLAFSYYESGDIKINFQCEA